ncbi:MULTISPECIES: DUF11 domain-containing protein [Ramlibacter]|uniref:DUF11 domain-containing protein n=1 Tax=Ramlibacter pinisoli TaxID=2682844 RepID=A0A6N8ITN7_9BURK|nr:MULTISPECIES: DUF11 domain-containing protein [Ramlibacter]MBA2965355.1 hypothetical protein [Ramlibacter sp. CGMCC 1.13660]MVQ30319.1 hypothetical protein [Ramlibacter pinisoli]
MGNRLLHRWLLLALLVLGAGAALAASLFSPPYAADMCPGDRSGTNLNCTANDVQITKIVITPGSNPPAGCTGGTTIALSLDVTMQFGSSDRYDVGIFLSQDGASPQFMSTRSGAGNTGSASCKVATLPLGTMSNGVPSPFPNLETNKPADTCGDGGKSSVPTTAYANYFGYSTGTGTGTFTISPVQVTCKAATGGNLLNIPFVVTWDNQQSPTSAKGGPGDLPVDGICVGTSSVMPNTSSKCSAPSGIQNEVAVVTLPAITKTNGTSSISPSDTTTYTISVQNTTGVTITGSVFKDPAVANLAVTGLSCAAAGGASCPTAANLTVAALQGAGITLPSMPNASSLTFTVNATLSGNPTGNLVNTASVTVGGVANTAVDSDTIVYPTLVNQKLVTVVSDPVRGTTNPLAIPGAVVEYTLSMSNTGQGRVDNNTVFVTDAIPANTAFSVASLGGVPASSPITFTDGATTSNLTVAAADIQYSNNNGATWTYTPVSTGGYDANVTNIRVNPKGRMAAASSFVVKFRVRVN